MSEGSIQCVCERCKKNYHVYTWTCQEWFEADCDADDEGRELLKRYELLCPECNYVMLRNVQKDDWEAGESFCVDEDQIKRMLEKGVRRGHGWCKYNNTGKK